jgi:hypothetical protein
MAAPAVEVRADVTIACGSLFVSYWNSMLWIDVGPWQVSQVRMLMAGAPGSSVLVWHQPH